MNDCEVPRSRGMYRIKLGSHGGSWDPTPSFSSLLDVTSAPGFVRGEGAESLGKTDDSQMCLFSQRLPRVDVFSS